MSGKKVCIKCNEEKELSKFQKNGKYYHSWCKQCCKEYHQEWYQKNKIRKDKQNKEWRLKNLVQVKENSKRNYIKMLQKEPWKQHYKASEQRCNNPNRTGYEHYGGKGIEFRMTLEDFKYLWFRDEAWELERPSIDRIDNDGHYELSNCRFIELVENCQDNNTRRNSKGQFERIKK